MKSSMQTKLFYNIIMVCNIVQQKLCIFPATFQKIETFRFMLKGTKHEATDASEKYK